MEQHVTMADTATLPRASMSIPELNNYVCIFIIAHVCWVLNSNSLDSGLGPGLGY